ncbi:hypothetical protein METBIDRAFT_105862 [Metschnikowia bicuspidata var. bicuspidata NRRL YB-4993]|uniref:D-aminoacid aminotransferase-like PLP-dependent enzyme n=1 Tax=Metschnikowia bicuspidata var. bicuspidata NRRL YB-4993 TaxID=869754 RepID=A0A1A0HHU0_9ASCO|nr:hypothetical protein METBIDRAFT_105862 [Metschnikowia bicuspidata var. bicuspidata NRRL YB-4993]OBA23447.1 hypothetical protein METBIDRAFT_105862 [Metschnikowia bicuspidata var. bicuspidata NRRL YB-4993]
MSAEPEPELPTYEEFISSLGKKKQFTIDVPFELLSTIRYDPLLSKTPPRSAKEVKKENFFLLPEHIERIKFTLEFFGRLDDKSFKLNNAQFTIDESLMLDKLIDALEHSEVNIRKPLKIRLLINKAGDAKIELYETAERKSLLDGLIDDFPDSKRYDVYVDKTPVLASPFTSFKTTHRDIYTEARTRALPGKSAREEVIVINTTSEVMEGSITNIAIKSKQGIWITPKLTSGCLCGVTRHFLLRKNFIQEGDISVEMLRTGHDVMLMNGVMGCVRGTIKGFVG